MAKNLHFLYFDCFNPKIRNFRINLLQKNISLNSSFFLSMLVKYMVSFKHPHVIKAFLHPESFQKASLINSTASEHTQFFSQINTSQLNLLFAKNSLTRTISYRFCSSFNSKAFQEKDKEASTQDNPSLIQILEQLKHKILETTSIKQKRIQQVITHQVEKELQKNMKSLIRCKMSEQEEFLLRSQQKIKIHSSLIQNYEFMNQTQSIEDHRAMIMIRLSVLWNEQYQHLSIEQLIDLIHQLDASKQLKNNQLKSMATIFLAVETLKKCIFLPRIHKNMVFSSNSIFENLYSVKRGLEGQMKARQNLQKVQNLLSFLQRGIEKNCSRMCFMKVQSQLQYLINEIFKSFHEPNLYNDKSVCLTANPPRVVFDEPFHQEYDRFIQMAVLILYEKKLKSQAKMSKLESITHIFQKLKTYEEGKLRAAYENENSSPKEIRRLKGKVMKMGKRLGIIEWFHGYLKRNVIW